MEYNPNRKSLIAPMEYTLMAYSPNGKGTVLWKIVLWSGNGHGKWSEKYIIKDVMSVKVNFMYYMK